MNLSGAVLAVADAKRDLRQEVGVGEEIPEDAVVVGEPPDVERGGGLLPGLLDPIQIDFHWRRKQRRRTAGKVLKKEHLK